MSPRPAGGAASAFASARRLLERRARDEARPEKVPAVYASPAAGVARSVLGHPVPLGARLMALYFGAAPVDRSATLDVGYPVEVLDPIPRTGRDAGVGSGDGAEDPVDALETLCLERARAILGRARAEGRGVRVLWSGGIDSTAALAALQRVAEPGRDALRVLHGDGALAEHPRFLAERLGGVSRRRIARVRDALGSGDLVVTGEHGDQLFGSAKALSIGWEALAEPWPEAFARELRHRLASSYRADALIDWIGPQVARAPVPVVSLWDLLWWLAFSLKWQAVTMRIPAQVPPGRRGGPLGQLALTEHFYRPAPFQRWALAHRGAAVRFGEPASYKGPLKRVLHRFDGDERYLREKRKEPSLGALMVPAPARRRALVVLRDGRVPARRIDRSLGRPIAGRERRGRRPGTAAGRVEVEFEAGAEAPLWTGIDGSGE